MSLVLNPGVSALAMLEATSFWRVLNRSMYCSSLPARRSSMDPCYCKWVATGKGLRSQAKLTEESVTDSTKSAFRRRTSVSHRFSSGALAGRDGNTRGPLRPGPVDRGPGCERSAPPAAPSASVHRLRAPARQVAEHPRAMPPAPPPLAAGTRQERHRGRRNLPQPRLAAARRSPRGVPFHSTCWTLRRSPFLELRRSRRIHSLEQARVVVELRL